MADAVEARSRSLSIYTEESINVAVEQMIDSQIADGQFKDAPISFRDVETVKSVFKEKIKNIYHTRIVYPDVKKEENKNWMKYWKRDLEFNKKQTKKDDHHLVIVFFLFVIGFHRTVVGSHRGGVDSSWCVVGSYRGVVGSSWGGVDSIRAEYIIL